MPCVFYITLPALLVSGGVTWRFCSGLELQRQRLARSFSYSACLSASALQHS